MAQAFELAKYKGKWSVFNKNSRLFFYIGRGKRNCQAVVNQLNTIINQ